MEYRISTISIIVEDRESARAINELLHQYADYIIGRMGLPCREKGLSVICVILEAPADVTSALSGRLGQLHGVSSKTMTAKK
ncbi:MAG: iron-only hydrogenase system regulator [Ruminococcaceae bacterium]|nr:iron-only hydrogenase system regulator [Oscillospiraceae bacterium]